MYSMFCQIRKKDQETCILVTLVPETKELSVENRKYLNLNLEPLTKVPVTKAENLTSISPTEVSKCNLNIKYV